MSAIHSLTVVSTTGRTLYGYPAARSLALWATHRVLLAEAIAPDLCRYNGTVNTLDNGELWYVFEGATQPGNWNEAVLPVFDLSSRTSVVNIASVLASTSLIGTGSATVSAPVTATGELQPIIKGQDYTGSNSFTWTFDEYVDFVAGSTVAIFSGRKAIESTLSWEVTGVLVDNNDGTWTVTAGLTNTQTALLDESVNYNWSVQLTYNGKPRIPIKNDPKRPVSVIAKAST